MGDKRKGFNAGAAAKCLLIGLLGSTILIGSYIFLERAWLSQIAYSEGLRVSFLGQMALLVFLVPVLTGIAAAWSLSPLKLRFNGSALAGLIAGITGGLGFFPALSALVLTWNIVRNGLLDWNAVHGLVYPVLTTGLTALFGDVLYLAMFTLLSMMLSAIGGGIYFVVSYYAGKGRKKKAAQPGMRPLVYIAAVLLAIIAIPIMAAHIGTASGLVKSESFTYPVDVQRMGADAITFTNNGLGNVADINASAPFIIYVSGGDGFVKDLSDQQAATADKLNVTLTPAGGLGLEKGSALTAKGPAIEDLAFTDNATGQKTLHVMVIGFNVDGQKIILREKSV